MVTFDELYNWRVDILASKLICFLTSKLLANCCCIIRHRLPILSWHWHSQSKLNIRENHILNSHDLSEKTYQANAENQSNISGSSFESVNCSNSCSEMLSFGTNHWYACYTFQFHYRGVFSVVKNLWIFIDNMACAFVTLESLEDYR